MDSQPQIEAVLKIPTPRPVRKRRVKVPQFAPVTFIAIFAIPAICIWMSLLIWILLWSFGTEATGTITRKERIGKSTRRVFYRFGSRFKDKTDISSGDFERLRVGDTFRIKLFASDLKAPKSPSHLTFLKRFWNRDWPSQPMISLFLWAGFASLMVAAWMRSVFLEPPKQKWLVENGIAAIGNVEEVSKATKNPTTTATYCFQDANGIERRGSMLVPRGLAPASGEQLTVLYDPQNPRRHTLYALARYEVAV